MKTFGFFLLFTFIQILNNTVIIPGVNSSQLWKYVLVLLMVYYICTKTPEDYKKFGFIKALYVIAFLKLLHVSTFENGLYFQENLLIFSKFLIFALLGDSVFLLCHRNPSINVLKVMTFYAVFQIILYVPFLFHFISSPKTGIALSDDTNGFIGLCGSPHGASIMSGFCSIFILWYLYYYPCKIKWKMLILCCLGICLAVLYEAYVRTGYAMFIVGFICLYLQKGKKMWHYIFMAAALICVAFWVSHLDMDSPFVKRLIGVQYSGEIDVGSGRSSFMQISLDYWKNNGVSGWLFGVGQSAVMDRIERDIGIRVYAHDGFVDMLTASGIIGIALMLYVMISIGCYLFKHRQNQYFYLSFAIYCAYYCMQATQGGQAFDIDLWLFLAIQLVTDKHTSLYDHTSDLIPNTQDSPVCAT